MNHRITSPKAILGMLACLLAASCGETEPSAGASSAKPLPKVAVLEATPGPVTTRRTWPATIEPLRVLDVLALENGRLIESFIQAGDRLGRGERMMTLRFPEIEAAREALASRVVVMRQEVARLEALASNRAVSEAGAAAVKIEKLEALSRLQGIEALLEEGAIIAPVAGTVLETLVSPGSPVVEGTVLARLADAASPGVRLDVPNPELRHFEDVATLTITTQAASGNELAIHRVVRLGGDRPNTTRLELWLAPDAGIAAPVAGNVVHEATREALMIPWSAIATDDDQAWVGQVDMASGEVRRVKVLLGTTSGTRVEVVEGLSAGDWVVRHEPRSFADGAMVDPEPAITSEDQ